jgi:hypothetical protein
MQGAASCRCCAGSTPADWRDAIYYQYFAYPDWHMVHRQYGVRTQRYKLIHYYEIGEWELFDLARDPSDRDHCSAQSWPRQCSARWPFRSRLRRRGRFRARSWRPAV